jgi:hypothetical protein
MWILGAVVIARHLAQLRPDGELEGRDGPIDLRTKAK